MCRNISVWWALISSEIIWWGLREYVLGILLDLTFHVVEFILKSVDFLS